MAASQPPGVEAKPSPLAESLSISLPGSERPSVTPIRPADSGREQPSSADPGRTTPRLLAPLTPPDFEGARVPSSRSRPPFLAVAGLALLIVGAVIGGWFYRRGLVSSDVPPPQQTFTPAPALAPEVTPPVASPEIAPAGQTDVAALGAAPLPAMQTQINIESLPPAVEVPLASRTPPPTVARAPRPAPPVRRNSVVIGELKAPVQKAPVTAGSNQAPPLVIGGASDLGGAGTGNSLLSTTAVDSAPQPPRPTVGGQLQPPKLISSSPPVYPPSARSQRVQGTVVLDALVDETGQVIQTTVIAGPGPLREAAQNALRIWKYQPARLNGEPIATHTTVRIQFALN
jgi:protein TonB